MKVTKTQLKQIVKEELNKLNEAMDFNEKKIQVTRIHDGFVDFLEAEKKFPMGKIPRSVLDAIMKTALTVVDSMEPEAQLNEISGKQRAHDERAATQKTQRATKEAEAEELRQALGNDWEVNVRFLENRYQTTVHKQTWGKQAGPTDYYE